MNAPTKTFLLIAGAVLAASADVPAAEPPYLAHNPFSRPQQEDIQLARNTESNNSQSTDALLLRATMVSGNTRYANVNGRISRTGDKILGYTLQRIFENRAVFLKNGKQTTVYVKPKLEEDYDPSHDTRAAD